MTLPQYRHSKASWCVIFGLITNCLQAFVGKHLIWAISLGILHPGDIINQTEQRHDGWNICLYVLYEITILLYDNVMADFYNIINNNKVIQFELEPCISGISGGTFIKLYTRMVEC